MKKKGLQVLTAALALVFAVSAGMLIYQNIQYQKGETSYAEAEELVQLPDLNSLPAEPAPVPTEPEAPEEPAEAPEEQPVYVDPYADALRDMDFTALREVNGDVVGWIVIPGTVISYPLVQGTDNQYYLKHTWKKTGSAVGAIFLECNNSRNLSDFNTIVYGHRMNNGSMFASLKHYKKQSYWQSHPCVYITDDTGSHTYQIFAAYEVSTAGDTYRLGFADEAAKQDFIDYCLEKSVIDTGITPTVYDQVLTLSTCTGNGHATRWVVQAVRKGTPPATAEEEAPEETEAPMGAGMEAPTEAGTDIPVENGAEIPAETVPTETEAETGAEAPAA